MAKSHHDYYNHFDDSADADVNANADVNVNVDVNGNADVDVNLKLVVAPELLHPEVGRHDLVLQVLKKTSFRF